MEKQQINLKMNKFYTLINENTTPLFRVSFTNKELRDFESNSLASHIGGGYFISVNHSFNLQHVPRLIEKEMFQSIINQKPKKKHILHKHYQEINGLFKLTDMPLDVESNMKVIKSISEILLDSKYDLSIQSEVKRGFKVPVLIISFKSGLFYGDELLTKKFVSAGNALDEASLGVKSFILELEVVMQDQDNDIVLYKLKDTEKEIISKIPFLNIDFKSLDFNSNVSLLCLQASPSSEFGRTLNSSYIEGIVDNFSFDSKNVFKGNRYLLKTYFRFGSSGAPYVFYDETRNGFYINAIQSEACPIQMDIGGQRNGMQYTHALATPIANVKNKLVEILNLTEYLEVKIAS